MDQQEKVVGVDKANLGLGLKLDQIEEEEFADRSSLDSNGAGGRGVLGRQPTGGKQVMLMLLLILMLILMLMGWGEGGGGETAWWWETGDF